MEDNKANKIFEKSISKQQASDTGMAMVLIFLLIGFFTQNSTYYKLAIPVLIINMIFPMAFYFIAIIWFGLTHLLGTVVSKIILSIVYIVMVIPTGLFRKLIGKDSLQLTTFKKSKESVLKTRNYSFSLEDIKKPY